MRNTVTFATVALILAWAAPAQAVPCPATAVNEVTANAGCALGSTNNDSVSQVNADSMFGFSDWLFAQKDDDLDGIDSTTIDIGLSLIGDTLSGTWSINDIWSLYSDVMLVFKEGNGIPDTYVGYLLVSGDTAGLYSSPFINPANGNLKNISHVTAYVRGDGDMMVPEPGTLALLGIGLFGMGLASRRKKD